MKLIQWIEYMILPKKCFAIWQKTTIQLPFKPTISNLGLLCATITHIFWNAICLFCNEFLNIASIRISQESLGISHNCQYQSKVDLSNLWAFFQTRLVNFLDIAEQFTATKKFLDFFLIFCNTWYHLYIQILVRWE